MLTVIGQGYVGLPLAMLAVGAGHDVVGLDVGRSSGRTAAAGPVLRRRYRRCAVTCRS